LSRGNASRIRRAPGIFARLRSFAYNILRFNQSDTIAQDRYAAALGGIEALNQMKYEILQIALNSLRHAKGRELPI
jgi:galactokinase/mevalonate kinase-like predicted kinase